MSSVGNSGGILQTMKVPQPLLQWLPRQVNNFFNVLELITNFNIFELNGGILNLIIKKILKGTCKSCISGGVFTVGGFQDYAKAPPEFIDPYSSIPLCENPSPIPWDKGVAGMVGIYLGNATIMFCGGIHLDIEDIIGNGNNVKSSCNRYTIVKNEKYFIWLENISLWY